MNINIVPSRVQADVESLTDSQLKAYEELLAFIKQPYDVNNFKKALIGSAGTGKTYLLKTLIINSGLSFSRIGLAAPTHKACRVLKESIMLQGVTINTLASDLGLKINYDLNNFDPKSPPFDPKGRIKIGDYSLYIVDEASMINRGLLTYLEKIVKGRKCKIIYVGDDHQLPPVNETYSPAFKGCVSYRLTQIVRQDEDNPASPLLELLRYDIEHKTFKFIETITKNPINFDSSNIKGYQVCDKQTFENYIALNFGDEQLARNVDYCKVIAYTNDNVSYWNKVIRQNIIKDADISIVTNNDLFISYTTIVDQFNSPIIQNSEDYIIKDVVNFVHPRYGFKGFSVRFVAIHGGHITTPLFILDHTDSVSVLQYVKLCNTMIDNAKKANTKLRAQKWREYYEFKDNFLLLTNIKSSNGTLLYPRSIDYGFALTAHKSQGSTFDTVFVDVNDIVYDKRGNIYCDVTEINRRLYVACSRCRNKLYLRYGK